MERKNIFRGKNKKNGWIYGDLIHNRGEVFIAPIGIANPFATAEDFVVDENSVGYFTSLKDKTDKAPYRDWETDRKSTRLNSSHSGESRMPSSA